MLMENISLEYLVPERKRCIVFAKDHNTVVEKRKSLYCVENITHKEKHSWAYMQKDKDNYYRIFNCLGDICIECGYFSSDIDFEKFEKSIEEYPYSRFDGFLKMLEEKEEKGEYINKVEIEACYLLRRVELYANYKKYREDYLAAKEEKERVEKELEERKREEEDVREKEERELKIKEAEKRIKKKEELVNFSFESGTIVLHLMKKYEIDIPIRTKGWINKALSKVWFDNGKITYNYYRTSKDSAVFYKFLLKLEQKISEVA